MSVLAVGLSHRSAPVSLLERVSVSAEAVPKLLHDLQQSAHIESSVVVSTCNRVEIYAEVPRFHAAVNEITELLARSAGVALDELTAHLYVHYEDRAVQHLFSVASGLDSMVAGEAQVLGQLRAAYRVAREYAAAGGEIGGLMEQALRVGKRVHAETDVDRAGASVVAVGLAAGRAVVGDFSTRSAVVIGAGSVGALSAQTLLRQGVTAITVVNRTPEHAQRVADGVGGRTAGLEDLAAVLRDTDIVISCTGSVGTVVSADVVADAMASRQPDRPLFVLDLALPHDIDRAVRALPGVTLVGLDDLRLELEAAESSDAVGHARRIVAEEVGGYLAVQRAAAVAPTVVALRSKAAEVVDAELLRLQGRLPELDERSRVEVATAVRRVVDKLLHAPTVRVKELAGTPDGQSYADVLGELFGLHPSAVAAVTTADVAVEDDFADGPPTDSDDLEDDTTGGRP
jgi:glutamyl-tRNA reductase